MFWLGKKCLFTQGRKQRGLGAAVPLRAATEALSPVGAAAAADGGAASWLAVAVRAEVLEGCCYISPPPHPLRPFLLPSLSFSLALYLSLTISLLLAHIPLNNPHLGQAGWEAIQCSAPLCRLRKETESERQRFSTQEEKKNREILTRTGRYQELTEDFHLRISFIYTYCLYIYIYIFVHTHIDIYIYIYIYPCTYLYLCLSVYINIFICICVCKYIWYINKKISIYLWIYMRITVNQEKQEEISIIRAGLWLCGGIQYFKYFLWSSTSRGQRLRAHFVFLFSCRCFPSLSVRFFFSASGRNKLESDRIWRKGKICRNSCD